MPENLTNEDLRNFYDSIPRGLALEFRDKVIDACEWNSNVWKFKINGTTPIKKLESQAIQEIMLQYTPAAK